MIHAMVISMDNDTSRVCSCTIINIPKWWGQIGILNCFFTGSSKITSPQESAVYRDVCYRLQPVLTILNMYLEQMIFCSTPPTLEVHKAQRRDEREDH